MRSWSVSSVRGWATCQLQWWFRRQGLKEEFRSLALVEGTALHAALAAHLTGMQSSKVPEEQEVTEILDGELFAAEMEGSVRWGKVTRDDVLARMAGLYREWAKVFRPGGEILAVEEEVRVHLSGLDLPLLGYADLVVRTESGLIVTDFKTAASKPYGDDLFDPLDLQRLAMTHGVAAKAGEPVIGWRWTHLVKTKKPQVIDDPWEVRQEEKEAELARLRAIVNPTIATMRAVEEGRALPVPSQSWMAPCSSCGFRLRCARWIGATPAIGANAPSSVQV